ncbi:MAG: hypothetical protein Q4F05_07325 [bacterium]|nr:hypothetical protein [bacterium]
MLGYIEVFRGIDMNEFNRIRTVLEEANIKYKDRCVSTTASGFADRRAGIGSFGENTAASYTYSIFVKKDQAENAKALMR